MSGSVADGEGIVVDFVYLRAVFEPVLSLLLQFSSSLASNFTASH